MASTSQLPKSTKFINKFGFVHIWNFDKFSQVASKWAEDDWREDEIPSFIPGLTIKISIVKKGDNLLEVYLKNCGSQKIIVHKPNCYFYQNNKLAQEDVLVNYYTVRDSLTLESNESKKIYKIQMYTPTKNSTIKIRSDVTIEIPQMLNTDEMSKVRNLQEDLKLAYETRETTADWTLECQNEKFKCHQFILGARTSFFKVLFSQETFVENKTRVTAVKAADVKTVEALIEFLYLDTIDKSFKNVEELFVLADYYGISKLKQDCEDRLVAELEIKNVCRIFQLATRHDTKNLKSRALEMIKSELKLVLKTEGWTALKEDPSYINYSSEIFESIAEDMD